MGALELDLGMLAGGFGVEQLNVGVAATANDGHFGKGETLPDIVAGRHCDLPMEGSRNNWQTSHKGWWAFGAGFDWLHAHLTRPDTLSHFIPFA